MSVGTTLISTRLILQDGTTSTLQMLLRRRRRRRPCWDSCSIQAEPAIRAARTRPGDATPHGPRRAGRLGRGLGNGPGAPGREISAQTNPNPSTRTWVSLPGFLFKFCSVRRVAGVRVWDTGRAHPGPAGRCPPARREGSSVGSRTRYRDSRRRLSSPIPDLTGYITEGQVRPDAHTHTHTHTHT